MRPQEEEGLPQHLLSSLISTTPWNEQVQSLNHLTELALSPSAQTLRQLRSLTPYFQSAINNPRSTLVRSVCDTISTLAETLQAPFVEAVGNSIIPDLLSRSTVTKAVIRESCVNAARSMFEYGVEGVHFATVRTLADTVCDRRAAVPRRATAALFLGMILVDNCRSGVQYIIDVVSAAIIAGCSDPDESVRATSRENWRRLQALDPVTAIEVLKDLSSQTVQLINRERDEFGDPFRVDRTARLRTPGTADMPARAVSRTDFRPGRVEIDEQPTQRTSRPHLRPPRRSVLPGAFTNLHPTSPDDSPRKRNEMHRARRVFSPMAIDTPVPVHTPASVPTSASAGTSALDTPGEADTTSTNDLSTSKPEESLHQAESSAIASTDVAAEKSTVSTVSYSTGSHSGTPNSQNAITDNTSHTTESSMSSIASTEKSVSAVSSSSVSTGPISNEDAFQKIAASGAPRGTNEDSPSKTPPQLHHSDAYKVSPDACSPTTKKGRLSYILGANQTPRVYTPLPPISRMIESEEQKKAFTPMDICTPMDNEQKDVPLSGVVMRPLARALEDRLDEAARNDFQKDAVEPKICDVAEGEDTPTAEGERTLEEADAPCEQDVGDEEHSPTKEEVSDMQNSTVFEEEEEEDNANRELDFSERSPDKKLDESEEKSSEKEVSTPPDLPSTPDSVEDELLKEVASLTSSGKKKRDSSEDFPESTSWETLVQDLEKTLGLHAAAVDDSPVPEQKDNVDAPTEKIEDSVTVDNVMPGEGKENESPVSPQQRLEDPKPMPEPKTSSIVEEKEKAKTEMTKEERQAALARRPPRRSINPGAIKPMPTAFENKPVRPSIASRVPPRTERRKPPIPSFSRKPPVPRKLAAGSSGTTVQPPSTAQKTPTVRPRPSTTAQKPPATARKPPPTARKPPSNKLRASTALMQPKAPGPVDPSVRRVSTPVMRPAQSTPANTTVTADTTQQPTAPKSTAPKSTSALPPKSVKPSGRKQTPRQAAVIDAYRACARAKKGDWSTKWKELRNLEATIKALQGDTLPPRLCDDATALLGEYAQETHHKVQLSALDALFFLLLCTERPPQTTALHRALEKRPDILRRVLGLLKDGREDVRLACGRVMQGFEVLFGPEVQIVLLVKAVSGTEGKIAEMGCAHMLKAFERAKQGDGFVWKAGVLESLVSLLASLKQNRRVEVRQGASKVLEALKECLPDRAFEIVCKKVGVSVQ